MLRQIVNIFDYLLSVNHDLYRRAIQKHKSILSKKIRSFSKSTVLYGPFKGMRIVDENHWSDQDVGSMILGCYEMEILSEFSNIPDEIHNFIDLGAADGYYGIGMLINSHITKSYCYEISPLGRTVIEKNALLNNVADKVVIRGEATRELFNDFPNGDNERFLILVDVEGAEFDLFDTKMFNFFKRSIIIMEVHDFLVANGDARLSLLLDSSKATHKHKFFSMGARDLSKIPELALWNDYDRWLLCAEGRQKLMSWIRFDPI